MEIDIKEFYFSPFKGVTLGELMIRKDSSEVALAEIRELSVPLSRSVWSMVRGEIYIKDASIRDAHFNVLTKGGDEKSNLDKFLESLSSNQEKDETNKGASKIPFIDLRSLYLENITLQQFDENTGNRIQASLVMGEIGIDVIIPEQNQYSINSIRLTQPNVEIVSASKKQTAVEEELSLEEQIDEISCYLNFELNELKIEDGALAMYNSKLKVIDPTKFDDKNFKLEKIKLDIRDFVINEDAVAKAKINNVSVLIDDQVKLKEFSVSEFSVGRHVMELNKFKIKTQNSLVSEYLKIENANRNWLSAIKSSYLNSRLKSVRISPEELAYFVPKLKEQKIYTQLQNESLLFEGTFRGRLANLKGRDIRISMPGIIEYSGDISARNLTTPNEELVNITIDKLSTSILGLRTLIPNIRIPQNFNVLGNLDFKGRFDGYFLDFVAFGNLETDLGDAELDMRLDLKRGTQNATYAGSLELYDFDLGKWNGSGDLGKVNMVALVEDGFGLTKENASAKFESTVFNFDFKGYSYKNIVASGVLDKNRFEGNLDITDDNVDLIFDGLVEFQDSLPEYAFDASIAYLDLQQLNLTEEEYTLSGEVSMDMIGKNMRSMEGVLEGDNLVLYKADEVFNFDSISILSKALPNQEMGFYMNSGFANVSLEGKFDIRDVPKVFGDIVKEKYPTNLANKKFVRSILNDPDQKYTFDIEIIDSENFFSLVGARDLKLRDVVLTGSIDNPNNELELLVNTPIFSLKGNDFLNVTTSIQSKNGEGIVDMIIDSLRLGSIVIEQIYFTSSILNDTLDFSIGSSEVIDSISDIEIAGRLVPNGENYDLKLSQNKMNLLGKEWEIWSSNKMTIGDEYISLENFVLSDGERQIVLSDINNKSLKINVEQFDVSLANIAIDYSKMWFSGEGDAEIFVMDLFDDKKVIGSILVPDLRINDEPYGELKLDITQQDSNVLDLDFSVKKQSQLFGAKGNFNTKTSNLYVDVDAREFPLDIFEYIIDEGISETQGLIKLDAVISGNISDLKLNGEGNVVGGQTKVDYLGNLVKLGEEKITITENFIDATGGKLYDINGNAATITGGMEHNFFSKFNVVLSMYGPDFVALNTTEKENPVYYGFGRGEITVDFLGPFEAMDIEVECKAGKDSYFYFPVRTSQYGYDESFIKFSTPESKQDSSTFGDEFKLLGLDFKMKLEITEEVETFLIFDETVGDVMRSQGAGNVSIFIKRSGEFEAFGDYEIERGEYLFTALKLAAKQFNLKRGGLVRWTGDPFNASLDVKATYSDIRTSLNVFLSEVLASASDITRQEARNRTNIELQLDLGGTLYNPTINFDINIPDVTGELRTLVENKKRTLAATPNAINNQVVGLLALNTFIPSFSDLNIGNTFIATASNTVTEFITNQLSIIVSEMVQSQLDEESFIQGIDLEFGLSDNSDVFSFNSPRQDGNGLSPDEFDFNSRYRFKNDDIVLNAGVNYVWGTTQSGVNNYVIGDIGIDWFITDDRRLKFKFYSKTDYDEVFSGRRFKNGFGLSYRKEFGNLSEFYKAVDNTIKESDNKSVGGR